MRKTPFASVHLTHEARDALRLATLAAQAAVGRRLSMSEVLLAALKASDGQIAEELKA